MNNVEILDAVRDASGGYKVDIGRGQRIGRVSSEWFSRPNDEQFLSLSDLFASMHARSQQNRTRTVQAATVRVEGSDNSEACADLERAIQIDPYYCEAHSNLAISLLFGWMFWGEPQIPGRAKALMHAKRAVEIDPGDSHAHTILGCVQLYERNWDEAKLQFDAAVQQNSNNADAVAWMGELQIYLGNPQAALIACANSLRLNPRPPGWYFWIMGMAQISSGHYEEAVAFLSRDETYGTGSREALVPALALAGRVSEAKDEARLFLAGNPKWEIADFMSNLPFMSMTGAQPFVDDWRLAGLPD